MTEHGGARLCWDEIMLGLPARRDYLVPTRGRIPIVRSVASNGLQEGIPARVDARTDSRTSGRSGCEKGFSHKRSEWVRESRRAGTHTSQLTPASGYSALSRRVKRPITTKGGLCARLALDCCNPDPARARSIPCPRQAYSIPGLRAAPRGRARLGAMAVCIKQEHK